MNQIENLMHKAIKNLEKLVNCVCDIPEPRMKNSENGISAYCVKCARNYLPK
jgi:hypothetical protein